MVVHQIFALIDENQIVQNVTLCENYTEANRLAVAIYGTDAIAAECTQWGCQVGDIFRENAFYLTKEDGTEERLTMYPTEEQEVFKLKTENEEMLETIVDNDYRLSVMELGL